MASLVPSSMARSPDRSFLRARARGVPRCPGGFSDLRGLRALLPWVASNSVGETGRGAF